MSKYQSKKQAPKVDDKQNLTPLEKLRAQCMARGVRGIKSFGRAFKIYDDDSNNQLSLAEFDKGLRDYGVKLSKEDKEELFRSLDKDGTETMNFDEFLAALRPPMSDARKAIILQAFDKADRTGDDVITVDDLKDIYKVDQHPKFKNGEWNKERCLEEFLKSFDSKNPDGKVTKEEFLEYYEHVGHSVDSDAYFDLMIRNSWKL